MFLILQNRASKSCHTGADNKWTGKKSCWLEEGEKAGDGKAKDRQQ